MQFFHAEMQLLFALLLQYGEDLTLDGLSVVISRPCCPVCSGTWSSTHQGEDEEGGSLLQALATLCDCNTTFSGGDDSTNFSQRVDFVRMQES